MTVGKNYWKMASVLARKKRHLDNYIVHMTHFTGMVRFTPKFLFFNLTKNYWNDTVIFTGTHINYSHVRQMNFSQDHSSNRVSTTSFTFNY